MMHLSREQAGAFYAVHKERLFYNDLVDFTPRVRSWSRCSRAKMRLPETAN